MQVYKNILVTIDCSPVDEKILAHVALLAEQNGAKLNLLHVVHSHTLDQHRELKAKAEKIMAKYSAELSQKNVETNILLRNGEPEKEILDEIASGEYDLVAMATHGHKFFSDLLYGSVSDALKHKIDIPLLMIRG